MYCGVAAGTAQTDDLAVIVDAMGYTKTAAQRAEVLHSRCARLQESAFHAALCLTETDDKTVVVNAIRDTTAMPWQYAEIDYSPGRANVHEFADDGAEVCGCLRSHVALEDQHVFAGDLGRWIGRIGGNRTDVHLPIRRD